MGRFCQHTEARCVQENRRCALWSIDIPIIREVPSHLRQAAAAIFGQVLRLVEPFREVKEVLIRVLDSTLKSKPSVWSSNLSACKTLSRCSSS